MAHFHDTPLMEITLRRYESPHNLTYRDTLKKICLSLGLLQPGDSRDIIVDILFILEKTKKKGEVLSSEEIRKRVIELRKKNGLSESGTASSNIRRQLKRLRDMFIVEKKNNLYRILENQPLKEIFKNHIKGIMIEAITSRIEEYLNYYEELKKNEMD